MVVMIGRVRRSLSSTGSRGCNAIFGNEPACESLRMFDVENYK